MCHMQWVTKYRYRIFNDLQLKNLCRILLEECSKRHNFEVEDADIQPDHVHVLVKLRPSLSPSKAMFLLKGYTSRLLFLIEGKQLSKRYRNTLRERSLWGDGKFMGSVGHITLEKAKEYLEKQEAHHAKILLLESPPFRVGEDVKLVSAIDS